VVRIREAWKDAEREGEPHTVALTYYSLGEGRHDASRRYLLDYYRFLGSHISGMIADNVPRTSEAVKETAAAFEDAGFDELVFDPTVAELDQVDLLASAVL
jgi:hypothetical protein